MLKLRSFFSLLLAVMMLLSLSSSALALNYTGRQGNEATFELLEETRLSGPGAVCNLEYNVGKTYVSHPVLDGYPEGTTYVYRSANLFGGRAAARLNTNLLVFSDKAFAGKDDALAYLKELGLIEIIDKAIGSVVLVTPANPDAGFTVADQKHYYALQTAMLAQKESGKDAEGKNVSYSDAEYFGGFGYLYAIGIDGGATFFNDYIAPVIDFGGRIAGALLINGGMDGISKVPTLLPVWLVNANESIQARYRTANKTDAMRIDSGVTTYYNRANPIQQVIVSAGEVDLAAAIATAYYDMFIHAMRIPVVKQGINSVGTPYQGYGMDQAPYSLNKRNPLLDGKTPDGIVMISRQEDYFSDLKTDAGEYLQTWYEYVPTEVLEGKVVDHTVPLVLAIQGGSDDPRGFVDENGWLALAGEERFIIVAPEKDYLTDKPVLGDALGALVSYMLEAYPAIDPSRVYATGYSKGGAASIAVGVEHPELIAAIAAMAPADYTPQPEDEARFETYDIPYLFTTSTVDKEKNISWSTGNLQPRPQKMINNFMKYNELGYNEYDFETYPVVGFETDGYLVETLNNEYESVMWYKNNEQGFPMVEIRITKDLVHALYPEYAKIGWDYLKHFSRDPETGEVMYTK